MNAPSSHNGVYAAPPDLLPVFQRFITCEYTSLTKAGAPITTPVTPYIGTHGTLDVSTGLVYPAKAERARRNPHVALLFSDPTGSGLLSPPRVLLIGSAAVKDADLQANTDRYVRESRVKLPDMTRGFPAWMIRLQAWYLVRIYIQVTPIRVYWWDDRDALHEWSAPTPAAFPASDPPPQGDPPPAWKQAPSDWRPDAAHAVSVLGNPVLAFVGADGYPCTVRTHGVTLNSAGFALDLPAALPTPIVQGGAACLTFHRHPESFNGQENKSFAGTIHADGRFVVERRIVDWSGGGGGALSKVFAAFSFLNAGRVLTPRLRHEAERRGQRVPEVRL
jgi:hypothetical protein